MAESTKTVSDKTRNAVYARDGFACTYCQVARPEGVTLSLDHVIPFSQGGSSEATNMVTVCCTCNSSKNDRSLSDFCKSKGYSLSAIEARIARRTSKGLNLRKGAELVAEHNAIKAYFSLGFKVRA